MDKPRALTDTVYEPTAERVFAACKQFDEQNGISEQALAELFSQYPQNDSNPRVLLKVAALNALYYTRILALQDVARHIYERAKEVDSALALGSPESSTPLLPLRLAQPETTSELFFCQQILQLAQEGFISHLRLSRECVPDVTEQGPSGSFLVRNPYSGTTTENSWI